MQPVGKAVEGPVLLGIRFIEDPVDRDGDPANDGATALQLRGVGNGSQICPEPDLPRRPARRPAAPVSEGNASHAWDGGVALDQSARKGRAPQIHAYTGESPLASGATLAKPNYNQQKKQKELARQARQNEKRQKRQAKGESPASGEPAGPTPPGSTASGG